MNRKIIDDGGAELVLRAAERYANERGYRVAIAVVDPWGELIAMRRTPGTQIASSRVALDKARTAAVFVRPSREIEQQVADGRLGALALRGASALIGGIPLKEGDEVVGAVGVSGETTSEDEAVAIAGSGAAFTTVEVPALAYGRARAAAEAAGAEAARRGVAPVAAVVDAGGELVYLHRPDAAQVASVGVATDKARTAAIYRRPSKDFEDQATGGRPSALHLARAVPLQGGIPLIEDGYVIGAVGVSGASSADEDQELALLGAAAFSPGGDGVTFVRGGELFERGGVFLDTGRFRLDAGRRSGPGDVEVHDDEVDVMHVVRGTATVVAGEARHELGEGDVLAIPAGVPHQFVEASDPFLYFVVKVAA